jgi:hypothetical protein
MPEKPAPDDIDMTSFAKMMGEFVVPGGSLMASGNLRGGLAHLLGSVLARAILGAPGLLLVRANSLSNFHSGKHLHEHLLARKDRANDEPSGS